MWNDHIRVHQEDLCSARLTMRCFDQSFSRMPQARALGNYGPEQYKPNSMRRCCKEVVKSAAELFLFCGKSGKRASRPMKHPRLEVMNRNGFYE